MTRVLPVCLLFINLLACSNTSYRSTRSTHLPADLQHTLALYVDQLKEKQDDSGFIYSNKCDSLLFSGLVGSTGMVDIEITAARDSDGRWLRRPTTYAECYESGASGSTISRDMLLGLLWYGYHTRSLVIMEQLWNYGSKKNWVMGKGLVSRTIFTPSMQKTLALIIYALGGPTHAARYYPDIWSSGLTDYQAHLVVLHIVLRDRILGELKESERNVLQVYADKQPQNSLFRIAVGDNDHVMGQLRGWPIDRLPTSSDWCEEWLWQRDYGDDWQPCDKNEEHSGGDFVFAAWLLHN